MQLKMKDQGCVSYEEPREKRITGTNGKSLQINLGNEYKRKGVCVFYVSNHIPACRGRIDGTVPGPIIPRKNILIVTVQRNGAQSVVFVTRHKRPIIQAWFLSDRIPVGSPVLDNGP